MSAHLEMFTIYDHPKDYPNHFVVRKWIIHGPEPEPGSVLSLSETLDAARNSIPAGLVCLSRNVEDDPVIVETWV